jgi:hypothetical protein
MRPLTAALLRLYPARWRARYGDEFAAVLEQRPLGPFDLVDVLLGAVDAHLHLRRVGGSSPHGTGLAMSLRVGGVAAVVGAPVWVGGFAVANGVVGEVDTRITAAVMVAGSLALLVALVGLSAFQARTQPILSWLAFALPAVGTVGLLVGALGVALGRDELTDAFYFGLVTFFVGSLLFGLATYLAAVLSRRAAVVLAAAPVLAIAGGSGEGSAELVIEAALACFTLGWCALGVHAIRLDRPSRAPRPA